MVMNAMNAVTDVKTNPSLNVIQQDDGAEVNSVYFLIVLVSDWIITNCTRTSASTFSRTRFYGTRSPFIQRLQENSLCNPSAEFSLP
jgi:hypothetical protein